MSDWISIVAIVVSVVSAVFAWCSVKQSKRQNEIAIHNQKLVIYQEFSHLMVDLMTIGGLNLSRESLPDFYKVVRLSEFYYGPELGADLENYFIQVDELLRARDQMREAERRNNSNLHEVQEKYLILEQRCQDFGKNLNSSLREKLRLVQPRQFTRIVGTLRTRSWACLSGSVTGPRKKPK